MSSNSKYIGKLSNEKEGIGNKAKNLYILQKLGFKVPITYVLKHSAYKDYKLTPKNTIVKIRREIIHMLSPNKIYAIRSSTNIEDSSKFSYAGQFKTVLNVNNIEEIIAAIID